ncbi:hypothetical protein KYC5002_23195 [Archangium violaceum]|uniref:hypothetical protein n=1 Tax=Archangium violaceum TaxID=83451 RepID=UPI002B2EA122|nr:hypothetical protein KYC5002_23195 [Archangium gephyra]
MLMHIDPIRSVLRALLSGLMLSACGGMPDEVGLAPAGETLGTQEAALDCAGASVTTLNIGGMSSWGGVLSGGGNWSVTYPANGVKLSFYVDGVWRGDQTLQGDANRSGSWSFNDSSISCGSHTFQVRAYPAIYDSSGNPPGTCATGSTSKTFAFTQGCPTANLSCTQIPYSASCTGSGSGGTGGYTHFMQDVYTENGVTNANPWREGGTSWGAYCPLVTGGTTGTRQITVYYKVIDSSGAQSPVVSRTMYCATR